MFWTFVLVAALAAVMVKLGMLSVWVSVFSVALQFAGVVVLVLTIALVWRKLFAKKASLSIPNKERSG